MTGPPGVTCVLFHHAGGASSMFHRWVEPLSAACRVVTPDLPGRRRRLREAPVRTADAAVRDLLRQLDEQRVTPPYVLLGHSMGALLAYEVATAWAALGRARPLALYVSGSRAPRLYHDATWWVDADDEELATATGRWSTDLPGWRGFGHPRRMALLRADLDVCRDYRWSPRPRLDCPVIALSGASDPVATAEQTARWADHTTGPFTRHVLPGSHFFLYESENADAVRAALRRHAPRPTRREGVAS